MVERQERLSRLFMRHLALLSFAFVSKQTCDIADSELPVTQLALNDRSGKNVTVANTPGMSGTKKCLSLSVPLLFSLQGSPQGSHVAFQMNSLPR